MDNLLFANIPRFYKNDYWHAWIEEHGFEIRTATSDSRHSKQQLAIVCPGELNT
jgi:hypothetical protein